MRKIACRPHKYLSLSLSTLEIVNSKESPLILIPSTISAAFRTTVEPRVQAFGAISLLTPLFLIAVQIFVRHMHSLPYKVYQMPIDLTNLVVLG